MSKVALQFASLEEATAYRDRFKIAVVQGDTAAMVIMDDRTLDAAKAERRALIQARVQEETLRVEGEVLSPQQIYDRKVAALVAIEAAASNDAVDAVTF